MIGHENETLLVNQVLDYAGRQKRRGDLFAKGDLLKKSKTFFNNVFMLEQD